MRVNYTQEVKPQWSVAMVFRGLKSLHFHEDLQTMEAKQGEVSSPHTWVK